MTELREFDVVAVARAGLSHPVGAVGVIVDLDGEVATVEFPARDGLDVARFAVRDLELASRRER